MNDPHKLHIFGSYNWSKFGYELLGGRGFQSSLQPLDNADTMLSEASHVSTCMESKKHTILYADRQEVACVNTSKLHDECE